MSRRAAPPAPRLDWAWFLDVDGTLVELARTPAEVEVPARLRTLLNAMQVATGGALALVSGRSVADVDRLLDLPHVAVAGQHGLEQRRNGTLRRDAAAEGAGLAAARLQLRALAARHPNLLLEDKGLSLALHYRAEPALASFVHRSVRKLGDRLGDVVIQTGKRVIEVKGHDADKGHAITAFMAEPPFRGRTPVFVGDDTTDEHGFAVVNALHGHSIKVGGGRTCARWRLADVRAVLEWLEGGVAEATAPLP